MNKTYNTIKFKATITKKGLFYICVVEKAGQSEDFYADNEKYYKTSVIYLPVFISLTYRGILKKLQKWSEENGSI